MRNGTIILAFAATFSLAAAAMAPIVIESLPPKPHLAITAPVALDPEAAAREAWNAKARAAADRQQEAGWRAFQQTLDWSACVKKEKDRGNVWAEEICNRR